MPGRCQRLPQRCQMSFDGGPQRPGTAVGDGGLAADRARYCHPEASLLGIEEDAFAAFWQPMLADRAEAGHRELQQNRNCGASNASAGMSVVSAFGSVKSNARPASLAAAQRVIGAGAQPHEVAGLGEEPAPHLVRPGLLGDDQTADASSPRTSATSFPPVLSWRDPRGRDGGHGGGGDDPVVRSMLGDPGAPSPAIRCGWQPRRGKAFPGGLDQRRHPGRCWSRSRRRAADTASSVVTGARADLQHRRSALTSSRSSIRAIRLGRVDELVGTDGAAGSGSHLGDQRIVVVYGVPAVVRPGSSPLTGSPSGCRRRARTRAGARP